MSINAGWIGVKMDVKKLNDATLVSIFTNGLDNWLAADEKEVLSVIGDELVKRPAVIRLDSAEVLRRIREMCSQCDFMVNLMEVVDLPSPLELFGPDFVKSFIRDECRDELVGYLVSLPPSTFFQESDIWANILSSEAADPVDVYMNTYSIEELQDFIELDGVDHPDTLAQYYPVVMEEAIMPIVENNFDEYVDSIVPLLSEEKIWTTFFRHKGETYRALVDNEQKVIPIEDISAELEDLLESLA